MSSNSCTQVQDGDKLSLFNFPPPYSFVIQCKYADSDIFESYYCQFTYMCDNVIGFYNGIHTEAESYSKDRESIKFFHVGENKLVGAHIINREGDVIYSVGDISNNDG